MGICFSFFMGSCLRFLSYLQQNRLVCGKKIFVVESGSYVLQPQNQKVASRHHKGLKQWDNGLNKEGGKSV